MSNRQTSFVSAARIDNDILGSPSAESPGRRPNMHLVGPGPFEASRARFSFTCTSRATKLTSTRLTAKRYRRPLRLSNTNESMLPSEQTGKQTSGKPTIEAPNRNFDCKNYEVCLGLAAAFNWNSFTCSGCNLTVNESLLAQANSLISNSRAMQALCCLPEKLARD